MSMRTTTLLVYLCFAVFAPFAFSQTRTGTTASAQPSSTGSTGATSSTGSAADPNANTTSIGTNGVPVSTGRQPTFNAGDGTIGDQIGQNAFAGQGNNAFVGRGNAAQTGRTSMSPQFTNINNSNGQVNRGSTGNSNVKRARPQQRIAFTYPKANLEKTRIEMTQRFKHLSNVAGADATISDAGVVTLSGMVADDDTRKLAEALARLEPGVRSVDNKLQVGPIPAE